MNYIYKVVPLSASTRSTNIGHIANFLHIGNIVIKTFYLCTVSYRLNNLS